MAFEIRRKSDGAVAHRYFGTQKEFGGPWGSSDFEQVEVSDPVPVKRSPSASERLDAVVSEMKKKGTLNPNDLSKDTADYYKDKI